MQALGLRPEDFTADDDRIEVWPCCWPSVLVFERLSTQWNVGPIGPVGLRYEALPVVMRLSEVPSAARALVFADVQVMERAALKVLQEK